MTFYNRFILMFILLNGEVLAHNVDFTFDELLDEGFNNVLQKDFRQVEIDYLEGYNRFCKVKNKPECSSVYGNLSDIYLYQGNVSESLRFAEMLLVNGCSDICMKVMVRKICENGHVNNGSESVELFCVKWSSKINLKKIE